MKTLNMPPTENDVGKTVLDLISIDILANALLKANLLRIEAVAKSCKSCGRNFDRIGCVRNMSCTPKDGYPGWIPKTDKPKSKEPVEQQEKSCDNCGWNGKREGLAYCKPVSDHGKCDYEYWKPIEPVVSDDVVLTKGMIQLTTKEWNEVRLYMYRLWQSSDTMKDLPDFSANAFDIGRTFFKINEAKYALDVEKRKLADAEQELEKLGERHESHRI